jgi:flagellar biosynthesis anti-sigma factor FlgM
MLRRLPKWKSPSKQDCSQANEAVHALPDVRHDKIQDLKERIRAGTYKVDSASVADKLVEEHFLTDFGKNNA